MVATTSNGAAVWRMFTRWKAGMATLQGKSCGPHLSTSAMRFTKRRYTNVRPLLALPLRVSSGRQVSRVLDFGHARWRLINVLTKAHPCTSLHPCCLHVIVRSFAAAYRLRLSPLLIVHVFASEPLTYFTVAVLIRGLWVNWQIVQ